MNLIKKYTNRKLYSTKDSTYITLQDIADLVLYEEEFQVVDNTNGADITIDTIRAAVSELALHKLSLDVLKAILISTNEVTSEDIVLDTEKEVNYTIN